MKITDLQISITEPSGYGEGKDVLAEVVMADDFDSDALIGYENVDDAEQAVLPRGLTPQEPFIRISVGGAELPLAYRDGPIRVTRSYDNIKQGWTFGVRLSSPAAPLGGPYSCYGPGVGKSEIDIDGVYRTDSGEFAFPLIRDGIVDQSVRASGRNGQTEVLTGVCRGGRFDGKKTTIIFPPGHGLTHGKVGKKIMEKLEEDQTDFEDGHSMNKELQIVDAQPLPTLSEIFESDRRRLLWNRYGYASNPIVGRIQPGENIGMRIEERDILNISEVTQTSKQDVVTLVVANGTQQDIDDCAETTETVITIDSGPDNRQASLYRQRWDNGAGEEVYDTLTEHTPSATDIVRRKIVETRKYRCEKLVEETIVTWEWVRQEVPRYWWQLRETEPDSGEFEGFWKPLTVYTDDQDGFAGGPAYRAKEPEFRVTSHTRNRYFYCHEDFIDGLEVQGGIYGPIAQRLIDIRISTGGVSLSETPYYGHLLGVASFVSSFSRVTGKIKSRSSLTIPLEAWDDLEPAEATKVWGDGSGVAVFQPLANVPYYVSEYSPAGFGDPASPEALLIPNNMSIKAFIGNEDNQLVKEVEYVYENRARLGSLHYFSEDFSSSQEQEFWSGSDVITTNYSSQKSSYTKTTLSDDLITDKSTASATTGIPGDLPAIDMLDFVERNDELYEDAEEAEAVPGQQARRGKATQIQVTVSYDFLLTCHDLNEVVTEFPWAENEDQLMEMAKAVVEESAAQHVTFTLPANFGINEAMPIHLTYRPLGIDHDIRVLQVSWSQEKSSGPITTEVECLLYPW